ncbi:MAG: tetratricopeptide repeat protein [Bacteroidetes bacterium]|nr:tetratricopeptide repeat protein [Bacteroidota bacterium]
MQKLAANTALRKLPDFFVLFLICIYLLTSCEKEIKRDQSGSIRFIDSTTALAHKDIRSNRDSSIFTLNRNLKKSRLIGYKEGEANALSVLGICKYIDSEFDSAIILQRQALEIRRTTSNPIDEAKSFSNIGELYQHLGDDRSALQFYDSALKIYRINDSLQYLSGIYTNIAIAHSIAGQDDSVGYYFKKSLDWAKRKRTTSRVLLFAYKNYGLYQMDINRDTAMFYLKRALSVAIDSQHYGDLPALYLDMADILQKDDFDNVNALKLYDTAILLADSFHLADLKTAILKNKLLLLDSSSWNEQRLIYKTLVSTLEGKYKVDRIKDFAEFEVKYNLAEKDAENKLLAEENKNRSRIQKLLFLLLIATVSVAIFIAINLRLTRRVASRDKELAEQKIESIVHNQESQRIEAMIVAEEKERKRIATELHDRVGSLLGALKLNYGAIEEQHPELEQTSQEAHKAVKNILQESISEVRKISHDMAGGLMADFGLSDALNNLITSINSSGKIQTELYETDMENALTPAQEIALYRVIQELISNSLKHAQAKTIEISLTRSGNQVVAMVEDDGKGFNSNNKSDGIGLTNMRNRIESINGKIWIDSHEQSGTTVTIEIPIADVA